MRLSIRAKIISAYVVLAALFLTTLSVSFVRLRQIGTSLTIIKTTYIPMAQRVNALLTLPFLDESFDTRRLMINRGTRYFIEAATRNNPQTLEVGLARVSDLGKSSLTTTSPVYERQAVSRIDELIRDILRHNENYRKMVERAAKWIDEGHSERALANNDDLVRQRRLLRSRLEFLSRRIDGRISSVIHGAVRNEQQALALMLSLLAITLVLTLFIGVVALLSLRPLERLKRAAREIAAGDLQQRVEIRTKDEVGQLAQEFNRMADAIEQRDQRLRKQQEQLLQSEKMAVVGRMASKISHEVRNPLNALSLNLEMLSDDVQTPKARKTFEAIQAEIERLNRVVENYLTLAHPSRPNLEETDLPELLRHVDAMVRPECEKRGQRLHLKISPEIPSAKTDSVRLEQALLNLLRNAMEATPAGGELGLSAQLDSEGLELEVWDKGAGFPPEMIPRIFEPFFTTKDRGTGLGLAITDEIIREQGGTIECESRPGEGARFRIRLPLTS